MIQIELITFAPEGEAIKVQSGSNLNPEGYPVSFMIGNRKSLLTIEEVDQLIDTLLKFRLTYEK